MKPHTLLSKTLTISKLNLGSKYIPTTESLWANVEVIMGKIRRRSKCKQRGSLFKVDPVVCGKGWKFCMTVTKQISFCSLPFFFYVFPTFQGKHFRHLTDARDWYRGYEWVQLFLSNFDIKIRRRYWSLLASGFLLRSALTVCWDLLWTIPQLTLGMLETVPYHGDSTLYSVFAIL